MNKLNITDTILDKLGFSEYWDEHGTWGGRTLTFKNGEKFRIVEQEEMDDDTEGHAPDGIYIANHYYFAGWFSVLKIKVPNPDHHDLYFLHEMYECLELHYPNCLEEFIEKCNDLLMGSYIKSLLEERLNITRWYGKPS